MFSTPVGNRIVFIYLFDSKTSFWSLIIIVLCLCFCTVCFIIDIHFSFTFIMSLNLTFIYNGLLIYRNLITQFAVILFVFLIRLMQPFIFRIRLLSVSYIFAGYCFSSLFLSRKVNTLSSRILNQWHLSMASMKLIPGWPITPVANFYSFIFQCYLASCQPDSTSLYLLVLFTFHWTSNHSVDAIISL